MKDLLLDSEGLPVTCTVCREEFLRRGAKYVEVLEDGRMQHYHPWCVSEDVRKRLDANDVRPKTWSDGPTPN